MTTMAAKQKRILMIRVAISMILPPVPVIVSVMIMTAVRVLTKVPQSHHRVLAATSTCASKNEHVQPCLSCNDHVQLDDACKIKIKCVCSTMHGSQAAN